jgi:hypothetical protein
MLLGPDYITGALVLRSKNAELLLLIFRILFNKSLFVSNVYVLENFSSLLINSYLEKERDSHGWLTLFHPSYATTRIYLKYFIL